MIQLYWCRATKALNKLIGHMSFPGTITVPTKVFEQIIEYAARSLKSHGFKEIYFVGDSGGNQDSQHVVAELLSKEWEDEKILVQYVGDYYFKNEQFGWLEKKGFSKWDIGFHAGIRDTSEMLTVFPAGVKLQYKVSEIDNLYNGSHGDASKASPEIGSQMLMLKFDAAVKQIERVRTMHVINNHGFGLRK